MEEDKKLPKQKESKTQTKKQVIEKKITDKQHNKKKNDSKKANNINNVEKVKNVEASTENKEQVEITSKNKEPKQNKAKNQEKIIKNNEEKEVTEEVKQEVIEGSKEILKEVQEKIEEIANSGESDKIAKQKEKKQKSEKKRITIIIIFAIIIFATMLFSIIFSLLNINNEKIIDNVSILGIDVSNLSIDEARQRINDAIEEKFSNEKDNIILKHGEAEVSVNANTFNTKFDVDVAVAEAYNIGRSGNIITNNYAILGTKIFKKEIQPAINYDIEFLNSTILDINSKMKDAVVECSYYIEDEEIIIVKGKAGYSIKKTELSNQIFEQLSNIHTPYKEIEIPVENKEPDEINLEKIRNEIYKDPQDAYVEKNPITVHTHVNGIDFGISMEEAKKLLLEDKDEYKIPLKITAPKKTLADLGEEAFPEQLATFSTIYDVSNKNRSNNIELATKKINGTIIMPGETFSYNKTVGKRTLEAGFKEGTAYIGGKVVPDVGGGICQLSSTLYNTALLANLEIKERSNHIFLTSYVSASRDATVYYGSLDFSFKNTRSYPIKIVAKSRNGVCKVSMYGIKEKTEYEVIIQSKITSYINYKTTYKKDATLEEGKEVVEQMGHNGCRSEGYRILKLNGKIVSQTLLSKDTYSAMERIVRIGTKKVSTKTNTTE